MTLGQVGLGDANHIGRPRKPASKPNLQNQMEPSAQFPGQSSEPQGLFAHLALGVISEVAAVASGNWLHVNFQLCCVPRTFSAGPFLCNLKDLDPSQRPQVHLYFLLTQTKHLGQQVCTTALRWPPQMDSVPSSGLWEACGLQSVCMCVNLFYIFTKFKFSDCLPSGCELDGTQL